MSKKPPKVGAVVVARMTSSRFPGKVMLDAAGKPLLAWLISRVAKSRFADDIVVATTKNDSDQPIADLAERLHVRCFRGSEEDVMARVLGAAKSADLDVVIHITGDCPLVDPHIIDQVVELFFGEQVDYAKNFQWGEGADARLNFPNGLDVEVFSTKVLEEVGRSTKDPWLRQHVTEPLYTWPQFKYATLRAPAELSGKDLRICVDTSEDYAVVKNIFEHFVPGKTSFTARDIVDYLRQNPSVSEMNKDIHQKKYKAAVIGLGNIGALYDHASKLSGINTHCGAYVRWSKTQLVGGCDPDPKKRSAFKAHWKLDAAFGDAREMLDELRPDVVSICTPCSTHAEMIRTCVAAGVKAILCEKPFVQGPEEGMGILDHCRRNKVILLVNHWMRFSALYGNIRKFIASGGIGTVCGGRYHYSKGLYNSGSHAIDVLRFLLGEIDAVRATDVVKLDRGDDNVGGVLRFDNGAVMHLTVGDYRSHFTTEIDLMGSEGRIRLSDDDRTVELYRRERCAAEPDYYGLVKVKEPPFACERGEFMVAAVANLIDALEGSAEPLCSGADALKTIIVLEHLKQSLAEQGKEMKIRPIKSSH
jgi:spore coat polysaccharide biosynthesis protein SpsF (cytidylyltransferase family)